MAAGAVTRVDADLMAAAKLVGDTMSRSASQQISFWARVGLELERSEDITHAEIVEVLGGRRDYDELGPKEQAIVRAEWSERLAARIAAHDLRQVFAERGQPYVALDDNGDVVHYDANGDVVTDETAGGAGRRSTG